MPAFPRDIRLKWDAVNHRADFLLSATGDLVVTATDEETCETWLIASLFSDRRADPGDVLPPGDSDPRGWWGDNLQSPPGDRMGSKFWLRRQATPQMPLIVQGDAIQATQWLIDDGYLAGLAASARYNALNSERIDLAMLAIFPDGRRVPFGFPSAVSGLR